MSQSIFLNKALQKDNIYPTVEMKKLADIANLPTSKNICNAVISNGTIVNVVSGQYGLLPNEDFFPKIFSELDTIGLEYDYRSINRHNNNKSFALDIVLGGEKHAYELKNGSGEVIRPFLRFLNSYDGSSKTSGTFGFFRQICSNGLHVPIATEIKFSIKHKGNMNALVMPSLQNLLHTFFDNDFFKIKRNFEIMQECPANEETLKTMVQDLKLWQWEKSEKNSEPALNSRMAIDIMEDEVAQLGGVSNMFIAYNALQNIVSNKLAMSFASAQKVEEKIYHKAMEMALAN